MNKYGSFLLPPLPSLSYAEINLQKYLLRGIVSKFKGIVFNNSHNEDDEKDLGNKHQRT